MKKWIAGLTALVMLSGMTALPAAGESFDAQSAYQEILDMYAHHLWTGWKDYIYKDGLYSNQIGGMENLEIVGSGWTDRDPYDAGYRLFDLNGDGVEELLLGTYHEGTSVTWCITDIYTYHDGQIVHLLTQSDIAPWSYAINLRGNVVLRFNQNMHGNIIGNIQYQLENGELQPFQALMSDYNKQWYFTEDPEQMANYNQTSMDWSEWTPVSDTWIRENYQSNSILPRLNCFSDYQTTSEKEELPVIPIQGKSGYDALLRNYRDRIEAQDFADSGIFLSPYWFEQLQWGELSLSRTGYVLHDINGDGIDELAVGAINTNGSFELYDLYTIYDGQITHLASGYVRDRFNIGTQGEVIENIFGGALHQISTCYHIENGKLAVADMFEYYCSNHGNDYYETWYHLEHAGTNAESWRDVTKEEFDASLSAHETLVPLPEPFAAICEESCMDITVSSDASCAAITENGEIYVWGTGEKNYATNTYAAPGRLRPTKVAFDKKAVAINQKYVLTDTGDVYYFDFDQPDPVPKLVLSNVRELFENAAVTHGGDLYLFGAGYDGNGNISTFDSPNAMNAKKVESLTNVVSACNTGYAAAAVTADGSLYTWGANSPCESYGNGHLGYISDHPEYSASEQKEPYPRKVEIPDVKEAKFDQEGVYLYVLKNDGTLCRCEYTTDSVTFRPILEQISRFTCGSSSHRGGNAVLAFTNTGDLLVSGTSIWGFGDGSYDDEPSFVLQKELTLFGTAKKAITTGDNYAVITQDGALYTWGQNAYGVVGNGEKTSSDDLPLFEPSYDDVFVARKIFQGNGSASSSEPDATPGDLNDDNSIDASDAAMILAAAANIGSGADSGLTAAQTAAADINSDGEVNASDAAVILQYAAAKGAGDAGTFAEFLQANGIVS